MKRLLRANKRNERPRYHLCVSVETVPDLDYDYGDRGWRKLRLYAGSAVSNAADPRGLGCQLLDRTQQAFWDDLPFVGGKRDGVWIWSYNALFTSTMLGLWQMMDKGEVKLKKLVDANPPWVCVFRYRDRTYTWVDLLNWYNCSMDDIFKMVRMTPLDAEEDDDRLGAVIERCQLSAAAVAAAVSRLLTLHRDYDLGCLRWSAAGQALQVYRHRFGMRAPMPITARSGESIGDAKGAEVLLPIIHGHHHATRLEREAYMAPLPQLWTLGRVSANVYHYDISSFFPSIMRDQPMPAALVSYMEGFSVDRLKGILDQYGAIASVTVESERYPYPVAVGSKKLRATGRFQTVLAGPELQAALDYGEIIAVHRIAVYRMEYLFLRYVAELYALRQKVAAEQGPAMEYVIKRLLNSLFGKFGQLSPRWVERPGVPVVERWGRWHRINVNDGSVRWYRAVGDVVQEMVERAEGASAFPAIPAYVCSYARLRMFSEIERIGRENIHYSSVDSLHLTSAGSDRMAVHACGLGTGLGRWRLVDVYDGAAYHGPNCWEHGNILVKSGVPADARRNEDGTYTFPVLQGQDEVLGTALCGGALVRQRTVEVSLYRGETIHTTDVGGFGSVKLWPADYTEPVELDGD